MTTIKTVTNADLDAFYDTMFMAFTNDPVGRYSNPKASDYRAYFTGFQKIFCAEAVKNNTAFLTDCHAGAIAWFGPGVHMDYEALGKYFYETMEKERVDTLLSVMDKCGEYSPEGDYWYLGMVGVDPYYTGQGLGGKLIKDMLDKVDQKHLPAYLESSNLQNVRLYERLGFVAQDAFDLGGEAIMTPMVRPAQ